MRAARLARNDLLALGVLALLMAGAFLIPWPAVREMLKRDPSEFAWMRDHLKREMWFSPYRGAPADYAARMRYSRDSGILRVTLSNKHDSPVEGLNLRADFSASAGSGASRSAWLRHESGGRYSAGGVTLPRGDWVMSLTASDRSGPLFRLEQPVTVD